MEQALSPERRYDTAGFRDPGYDAMWKKGRDGATMTPGAPSL